MIDRRGFLLGATALVIASCGRSEPYRIRLAAGEPGGIYHESASLLAAAAAGDDRLRIVVRETHGSAENLALLDAGEVDAALSQIDTVEATTADRSAIGRLYEDYLQLATRPDSAISTVAELRGSRISLGASGSGAEVAGRHMLAAAGLDPATDLTVLHAPLADAGERLRTGSIDALLWSGGVPTPALQRLPIRLVPTAELVEPMRRDAGPWYDRVRIPAGAYAGVGAVDTIGVANLMVSRVDLPDDSAAALAELLLYRALDLVPNSAAGTQFLDGRSLIETGRTPLHPGAAAAYRRWHG